MSATLKYEDPEDLWKLFEEYRIWAKENPYLEHDFVGRDGRDVYRKKERPLSTEGFENFIGFDLSKHFANSKIHDQYPYEYIQDVCKRIKRHIRQDQIEGGLAGVYNPNLTARIQGLVEQTSTQISVDQPLFPEVPKQIDGKDQPLLE